MSDPSTSHSTRRVFLDWLLGLAGVGWLASAVYPVLRYLTPLPGGGPSGPARLTRDEQQKLETQRFVIVPADGQRVIVFNHEGKLRGLDAKCTHEGCTVQYVPDESLIWCACHNGRFDLDGQVISGPPPRPLPQYAVAQQDDGSIVVTPGARTA